ncbi:DsbA family protein [Glycocaulis profundi]|nr:DsbA family protein [Glycocaulis profundi]
MRLPALAAAALLAAACSPDSAPAQDRTDAEIEAIVRAYILENPELIEEALIELQARAQQRERQGVADGVQANIDALTSDARDPSIGPDEAAVTIVEFFDYRCPYCHMTNDWVMQTIEAHGDRVRVVFKEFPVLGEQSVVGSRAALAVHQQGEDVYLAFHDALMSASGPIPIERIEEIAEEAGADVAAMREAMESEDISEHLNDIRALAREIGISGTPFFLIGDQVIPGADVARLEAALQAGLEG